MKMMRNEALSIEAQPCGEGEVLKFCLCRYLYITRYLLGQKLSLKLQ